MSDFYKFYVKMDGQVFGPYSAKAIRDLELLDDVLVTEERLNGQWHNASEFDFEDMARQEAVAEASQHYQPIQSHSVLQTQQDFRINHDGSISNLGDGQGNETQYSDDEINSEIKKWNWGAFFFNWIWGICNGVYWPLCLIIINFIPYIGGLISLGICVVLGLNGSEWAWYGKQWNSLDHFKRVQHNWATAILWTIGISILFIILVAIATAS